MATYVLNLDQDHERVFARHNATVRNEIRKGVRRGISVRATCHPDDISRYQKLYEGLQREKKWPFIYPAALTLDLARLSGMTRFFVAEFDGIIIGGGLFVQDGNSVYHLHGVADREYNHLFPSNAVINAGIRWGCETGAQFFNLGNPGSNKSLAQFKSSWGSRPEVYSVFGWQNPIWLGMSKVRNRARALLNGTRQNNFRRVSGISSWSERAKSFGELEAVCYAGGSERKNLMMHGACLVGAEKAVSLLRSKAIGQPVVVDFGCGTGRMIRFFDKHGCNVLGLDITEAMVEAARKIGLPSNSSAWHFNGLSIPKENESVDLIWVCAVLKYTLFPPGSKCVHGMLPATEPGCAFEATYADIAREMFRVLKPGGLVVQYEMYVDADPDVFRHDFEDAGFRIEEIEVLRRDKGRLEGLCEWGESFALPVSLVLFLGRSCAKLRYLFDAPERKIGDFRDYYFVWRKGGTVSPAPLEGMEEPPVLAPREARGGQGRSRDAAGEPLEGSLIPRGHPHVSARTGTT
jgi:SAM-dependent methyltransferase